MDKNRYLVGLIGLLLGFIISYFWTDDYNRKNVAVARAQSGANPHGGAAGGGAATMGDIQQVIANAKNNPKDFEAQVQAAGAYMQIGRHDGAMEYLENAYAADPAQFTSHEKKGGMLERVSVFLGELYLFEKNNLDGAEKWLKRAVEADPKNGEALRHLVETYAMKKNARAAEESLNRLKQVEPSHEKLSELQQMVADVKAGKEVKLPEH